MSRRKTHSPALPRAFVSVRVSIRHWMDDGPFDKLLAMFRKHRNAVDEMAFFSSAIHPVLPFEVVKTRAAILKRRMTQAREAGYRAGINVLSTLGHVDEYLAESLKGDFTPMTDSEGRQAKGSFCPNDPKFQDFTRQVYTVLAEAKPEFIWLDDDLRMDNHAPAGNGCFCPTCLGIFNNANGTRHSRESLYAAFNSGSDAEKIAIRSAWLEQNSNTLDRLFALIETTVHQVGPEIALGLMSGEKFYEGCDFDRWTATLAGPHKATVMTRPGGGFYNDNVMTGIAVKASCIGRQIAPLPASVANIQSEIENCPYQPLKKSARTVVLETAAYIGAGCTGAAYNILGCNGEDLSDYEPLITRIEEARPFHDLLVSKFGRCAPQGIRAAWNRQSRTVEHPLNQGHWPEGWDLFNDIQDNPTELFELGFPPAYSKKAAKVTLLSGNAVPAFSREELLEMLAGGVYMDGRALELLADKGLESLAGFHLDGWIDKDCVEALGADILGREDFSGHFRDCVQSFWGAPCAVLSPLQPSAKILGRKIGRTGGEASFVTLGAFENTLGGRVAVAGYAPWTFLQSKAKATQLKNLFRWLSRDTLPAFIASYHKVEVWARETEDGHIAALLLNASLDPADALSVMLRTKSRDGEWTGMDCATSKIRAAGSDGAYARFEIPRLAPWDAALFIA